MGFYSLSSMFNILLLKLKLKTKIKFKLKIRTTGKRINGHLHFIINIWCQDSNFALSSIEIVNSD
jgi:hypothetical protein